ncbi:class I SAM-dependent methyltransferase [bacterium]|nr:class I SAM-dependent methyltransferase [bacterium]
MNIELQSPGLVEFYRSHRRAFSDLYPSEQAAFEFLAPHSKVSILDLGCACGGLGWALFERFGCDDYTGIEIHAGAAREGNKSVQAFGGCVLSGDILQASSVLERRAKPLAHDVVVSLSAVDWNVDVEANVRSAWDLVKVGGHLVVSIRLHPTLCLNDICESFQPTTPESSQADEIAPYVVISVSEAVNFATSLGASRVTVFGKIGEPSATAVTPVDELFSVVAVVEKGLRSQEPVFDIRSPHQLRNLLESQFASLLVRG